MPRSLASNCQTASEESDDDFEFLNLDEESQLRKLIEQEEIDRQALEDILKAA